ncbi:MAG: IgGFc-binding protein [Flavobacteriales bacterium]
MRILTLLLCCAWLLPAHAQTTFGTEHWVTYMENLALAFNGPPSFNLVISSEVGANGTLTIPANGFSIPFSVEAGSDEVLTLPPNIYYGAGDEALFNFGMRVNSDQPVRVYAFHDRAFFSGASLILPTTALGTEYLVLARPDDGLNSPSQLVVMATQDSTLVEVTPSVLTVSFRPPNVPFTVTLNAGQSFQLQSFSDLSGTRVRAIDTSKPLALFAGARQAQVNCNLGGADDHIYEQIYPLSLWGREYHVVPFKDRGGDEVRIMAGDLATSVTVGTTTYELAPREVVAVNVTAPRRIQSSAPIAVGQFNDSQECNNNANGDPNYIFLPAAPLRDDRFLWNARNSGGPNLTGSVNLHFVNVVVQQNGSVTGMLLDGTNISSQFIAFPNLPNWWYAQVSVAEGSHELVSDKPFQATAYGMGFFNSYGYALGFDNELATGLNDDLSRPARNATLLAANSLWTPHWDLDGGSTVILRDLRGAVVRELQVRPSGAVDLAGLSPGVYLAEGWIGGERVAVQRLVIQ